MFKNNNDLKEIENTNKINSIQNKFKDLLVQINLDLKKALDSTQTGGNNDDFLRELLRMLPKTFFNLKVNYYKKK